ncbi:hypothetical protein EV421DRAFT_1819435, partial [Armillaria borealis]
MESWRGRGVGSWAVPQLFDTHEVKAIRSSYLFAWPAVLNHLEPLFPQTTREDSVAKGERVIKFYRSVGLRISFSLTLCSWWIQIGFRRLANTSFFCLAKDPAHRSRQIAANEDAEFKTLPPPKDDNEELTGRDNPHVDVPTYIAEWPWLEQLLYTIQKKDIGEQLGRIRVPGNRFFRQMDAVSDDLSNLASAVFTSNGRLNTEVRESGLCLWDADDARKIYDSPIVYIQEIQVNEGWRGKGIGSWAVTQLFETAKVKGIGSSYLFTWPSILGRYDPPPRNHVNPGAPPTKEDQDAWEAKRDPIIKFFRS